MKPAIIEHRVGADRFFVPVFSICTLRFLTFGVLLIVGVGNAQPSGWIGISAAEPVTRHEKASPRASKEDSAGPETSLTLEAIFATKKFSTQARPIQWDAHRDWLWSSPSDFDRQASTAPGPGLVGWRPADEEVLIRLAEQELTPDGATGPLEVDQFQWTADRRFLLVMTRSVRVWRAKTRGDFWLLDRTTGHWRRVGKRFGDQALMFATFSPDGRRIAYVAATSRDETENLGLYVETTDQGVIQPVSVSEDPAIIDGTFDWVNEEELGLRRGFRFSPDGSRLAFWQVDTTGVPRQTLIDNTSSRYPKTKTFAYPKVGQINSAVRIGVADLIGGEVVWADLPGDSREHYLAALHWAPDSVPGASGRLIVQQLNRPQNRLRVCMVDCQTGRSGVLWQEQSDTWVTPVQDIHWRSFAGGEQAARLIWQSERTGFRHLYEVAIPLTAWSVWQADEPPSLSVSFRPLTDGPFDVESVLACRPESGTIDYIAAPDDPTGRFLFRVEADHDSPPDSIRRVSLRENGTYRYEISPSCQFALETWSDRETPPIQRIVRLQPYQPIRMWSDNERLLEKLRSLPPVASHFLQLKIPLENGLPARRAAADVTSSSNDERSDKLAKSPGPSEAAARSETSDPDQPVGGPDGQAASVTLDAWVSLPPGTTLAQLAQSEPSSVNRPVPLLVYVYGEPAGQTVVDRWRGRHGLWHRYLNQLGIAVATIDNRGTASPRGRDFRHAVHGRMGSLPAADLSAGVQELLDRLPGLDRQRVAVWGWSGGGSTSLHLIFRYPDQFAAAIAVAPVADALDYDTIYQERYYGLLDRHAERYRKGSPIEFATGLQDPLLIIHGTGDDNVHYASTERLINRLIELDKPFQMMAYPGRTHSISEGSGTALHQRKLMTRFLVRHLLDDNR